MLASPGPGGSASSAQADSADSHGKVPPAASATSRPTPAMTPAPIAIHAAPATTARPAAGAPPRDVTDQAWSEGALCRDAALSSSS
jgi:hypothetical protein